MKLKVIEERFMPMMADEEERRRVSAYDLFIELGHTKKISEWLETILSSKWIIPEEDYLVLESPLLLTNHEKNVPFHLEVKPDIENEKSKVSAQNVIFSPEAAKHICMMADTDVGYQIRKYLIDMEKDYKLMEKYGIGRFAKERIRRLENELKLKRAIKFSEDMIERILENEKVSQTTRDRIVEGQLENIIDEYHRITRKLPEFLERILLSYEKLPYDEKLSKLSLRTNMLISKGLSNASKKYRNEITSKGENILE